ncbi:ParB N-terminal domain-containing protein [Pseudomonas yangonensis]|uniref:ParB N-terminal domain-containing protein n=1 Tax=Pseudomonas yangonensis TaxID=2579922 RepID=UPI000A5A3386|nr:ParB N-terminal domain-containing protein [Pseudomonas yangonensis]
MSEVSGTKYIPVADLHFDRSNPRLAEYGIEPTTQDSEILQILWDAMDVRELVQSISASGFFPHEAVIAAEEDGKYVVIEGNRRLAAVKVLLSPATADEHGWPVPKLSSEDEDALKKIPVIISDRESAWRYLGFKHVNGPAKWSSYAKAAYIAEIHRKYKIPLAEIANQIGDRHNTVQRLFRGLMTLEQAEKRGVYDREDRFRQRLSFSHLYTGLDYEGIGSFLNIAPKEEETENPVPEDKLKELGELCVWLYGSKKNKQPPVVESQNPDLRRLNAVVANREAIAALRAGTELSKAFEISRPPAAVFEEALLAAKRELTTARANLTTGYDRSEALLRIAGSIANIADDIYQEMERKQNPQQKKSRLAED